MNFLFLSVFLILFLASTHAGVGRSTVSGSSSSRLSTTGSTKSKNPYNHPGLGNEYGQGRHNPSLRPRDSINRTRSARNISTFQIVFILSLIMSVGFVGYYFIQFYPFICSKESNYDVMKESRSSVTPSREFEYEESTSSATKSTNASRTASYSNEHDV